MTCACGEEAAFQLVDTTTWTLEALCCDCAVARAGGCDDDGCECTEVSVDPGV